MKKVLSFLALGLAFFLATSLGWWTVPIVGALWGALRPAVTQPAFTAALAAGAAWGAWLLADSVAGGGALGVLAQRLGGVMNLPGYALFALTLLFPALLAWSAAAVSGGLAGSLAPRTGGVR